MIYICIPAHNEEQTVGVVLWKIRQVMAEFPRDYQLLVVDDASTDKTPEVLAPYARVLPLTVVRSDARKGEGAATEMMLREAVRRSQYPKRDVIVTLQADFTQEPDELIGVIKRLEAGADIVVGQTPIDPNAPWAVRWARRLALRVLGRKRIPEGVTDPFTSYRGYRVFTVKRALEEKGGRVVHWNGWAGAAELLLAMAPHARRIDTVDMAERRERLQRATRLEPWVALKAVWSLAREAKPVVVHSPAELDEAMRAIAAVRTSEVATARQGGRTSPRTQRTEGRRGSSEERARRGGRPETTGRTRNGDSRGEHRTRGERPAGERRPREEGRKREETRPPRPPRAERTPRPEAQRPAAPPPDVAETQLGLDPLLEVLGGDVTLPGAEPSKRKRKRPRRRKRGAGNGETAANGELSIEGLEAVPAAGGAEGDEGSDEGMPDEAGEGGGTGEQKARRRRRGRRGGRRRNGAAAAGAESPEGMAGEAGEAGEAEPRTEAAGAESVPVFTEGERTSDA